MKENELRSTHFHNKLFIANFLLLLALIFETLHSCTLVFCTEHYAVFVFV
jgi:hypothetical protein